MSPVEIVMQSNRKKIIIGAGIVAGGLWILLVMYLLAESKKDYSVAQPGIVAVHAPSPVAPNAPSASFRSSRSASYGVHHQNSSTTSQWSFAEQVPMTSTSLLIHESSNATVHHIGGSTNGGGFIAASGNQGSPKRTLNYTTMAYSGTIYIPLTSNAITAVGAQVAGDVSQQKMGAPERHVRSTTDGELPEYPEDPVPDEVEQPLSDIAWPLMLLLTIGWCVRLRLRKQQ